jgi:FO synthase
MRAHGRTLVQRLPMYNSYIHDRDVWIDKRLHARVLAASDSEYMARDSVWFAGDNKRPPQQSIGRPAVAHQPNLQHLLSVASSGGELSQRDTAGLFAARGDDFRAVCQAADELRAGVSGNAVRYVVNRNINYTNVCSYRCAFCAFSKGKSAERLRGPAYDLDVQEIGRRVNEAWARGATEVCMQGGIHPDYTGESYLAILRAVKNAVPDMHVHAFSPLEIQHGAQTLGVPVTDFLKRLRDAGLGSLPGTAAEILDDDVRAIMCPGKLATAEWLDIVEKAHRVGLRTTATIMFGHVDRPEHWARHLLAIRRLQERTGGFTEFVPLPFVHMEAPIYFKGCARRGPTWREAILMHAVARLLFHSILPNVQVSWVKMGIEGAKACLQAGANDLGGTLMNESISRAAGAEHGQETSPEQMDAIIVSIGRSPEQRTTLYQKASEGQKKLSYSSEPLSRVIQTPARRRARIHETQCEASASI